MKIGVIVPVYNAEAYLRRCIDSVLEQTYTEFILILINDGSTDSSGRILDEYASLESRIIVKHTKNQGHAFARNEGLDIAFSLSDVQWITFIDSDDWVDSHFLELLYTSALKNKVKMVLCGYDRVYEENSAARYTFSEGGAIPCKLTDTEDFWCDNRITATIPCAKLYSRELFKGLRFLNKIHDDEHTIYRILFQTPQIVFIDKNLYHYYYNPNSVMASGWSPKHLDAIDAIISRREYFRNNGYTRAENLDCRLLIQEIYDSLQLLDNYGPDYNRVRKKLKKQLREELKENGNSCGLLYSEYNYLWLKAFPTLKFRKYLDLILNKFCQRICVQR